MLHRRWKSGISRSHTCLYSHLPSLLTELLPSLLHFHPRAWGQSTLGNWVGGTTQSCCGLQTLEGPLRATEASGLGPPPTVTSQSPGGVKPPSFSPSLPEALSSGRRSQRQGDQLLWEVLLNMPSLPCLGGRFSVPTPFLLSKHSAPHPAHTARKPHFEAPPVLLSHCRDPSRAAAWRHPSLVPAAVGHCLQSTAAPPAPRLLPLLVSHSH